VATDGSVYVADAGNYRVQRFDRQGTFLGSWGEEGAAPGQFRGPLGIAVAPDGSVYVADAGNDRVQRFGYEYASTWRGEYYDNAWLAGAPALIRQEESLSFDWGNGSPSDSLPPDGFSARWCIYLPLAQGRYRFEVQAEGGARLWVGEELLVEDWDGQGRLEAAGELTLEQDDYVFVEAHYRNMEGPASFRVVWHRVG